MEPYKLDASLDANKVFVVKRSELEGRFDPEMTLYKRKVNNFKFHTINLGKLLLNKAQYGANESGIERVNEEEPRYIRITDINENGELINNLGATALVVDDKYILNDNDLIIARSGNTVGKAFLFKESNVNYKCFFAGYMIRFIFDTQKVSPDYIFTFTQLNVYKEWVKAIQRTSGQPNINAEEYKSLPIPVPPIEVQENIVSIIQNAYAQKQAKEAEAKALLANIDVYLLKELGITLPEKNNSLEAHIFTTNFSEVVGGRFDAYYYQKEFKEFFNILVNSNYKVRSLKEISTKITSGITPTSKGDDYVSPELGIPFIRSGNIDINGDLNFEELLYLSKEIHNTQMKSSKVLKNDLMIAIVGATIGQVGIYLDDREANINQAIALVRLKNDVNPEFIKEAIKSSVGQWNLNRLKRPVARANINLEEISTLSLPIPPLEKQNAIAEHITDIRTQAKILQQKAEQILANAKKQVEQIILG